jgi:thioesterase domain-containing protein
MDTSSSRAAARRVNAYLARHVPITQAMGIRVRSCGADGVTMSAPLKPNINDKGIAFGGTLASILALSGWAFTDLALRAAGEAADVLIAVATIEYLAPVAGRIVARCPPPPDGELAQFLSAYRRRRRARLRLVTHVEWKGARAAVCTATYVARPFVARRGS